jgi:hypothetical protein
MSKMPRQIPLEQLIYTLKNEEEGKTGMGTNRRREGRRRRRKRKEYGR